MSSDDSVSRLIFVKGTDVLADVELHRVYFQEDVTEFSKANARFEVARDDYGATLHPVAAN